MHAITTTILVTIQNERLLERELMSCLWEFSAVCVNRWFATRCFTTPDVWLNIPSMFEGASTGSLGCDNQKSVIFAGLLLLGEETQSS